MYEPGSFVSLAQVANTTATFKDILVSPQYAFADDPWRGREVKSGTVAHYHCDHLGTPQELTDEAGNLAWSAHYKAWGKAKEVISDAARKAGIHNPLRFQGQYYDFETGLHYNRHRYYDPEVGRFLSRDPIGLRGGINIHQYAPNPVAWVDPLGLSRKIVNLGDGWTGGIDVVPGTAGQFEIHVFDPKGREVGMYGADAWFNKHGHKGRPENCPANVENQLKGQAIDILRRNGQLPPKGQTNIKNNRWRGGSTLGILGAFSTALHMLTIDACRQDKFSACMKALEDEQLGRDPGVEQYD